jgi:hypothetical protein
MAEKQYSVYLRDSDSAALEHIRHKTGIKSAAEVVRVALQAYARSHGWEPSPALPAETEPCGA